MWQFQGLGYIGVRPTVWVVGLGNRAHNHALLFELKLTFKWTIQRMGCIVTVPCPAVLVAVLGFMNGFWPAVSAAIYGIRYTGICPAGS